MVAQTNHQLK